MLALSLWNLPYDEGHEGDWNCSSYLARSLDAEQTRVLRHDAIPFPTRKAVCCAKATLKICANQVLSSEQEVSSQKWEWLSALVVNVYREGSLKPNSKMRRLQRKVNKRQEGRFLGKDNKSGRRWATKTKRAAKSREASRAQLRRLTEIGLALNCATSEVQDGGSHLAARQPPQLPLSTYSTLGNQQTTYTPLFLELEIYLTRLLQIQVNCRILWTGEQIYWGDR